MNEICLRLKSLRVDFNLSEDALSNYLDISENDLKNIEFGNISLLDSVMINRLSDLYFCSVDYLLTGKNNFKTNLLIDYTNFNKSELHGLSNVLKIIKNMIEMDDLLYGGINEGS